MALVAVPLDRPETKGYALLHMTKIGEKAMLAVALVGFSSRLVALNSVKLGDKYYPNVEGTITAIYPRGTTDILTVARDGSCQFVNLFDLAVAEQPSSSGKSSFGCFAAATDGEETAAVYDGTVISFRGLDKSIIRRALAERVYGARPVISHVNGVSVIRFARDGRSVAFTDGTSGLLVSPAPEWGPRVIDKWEGHKIKDLRFTSDGGNLIALAENGELAVWDWQAERVTETALPPAFRARAMATASAAPLLALASPLNDVKIFSTEDWRLLRTIKTPKPISVLEFDADGQNLAIGDLASLAIFDPRSGRRLGYSPAPFRTTVAAAFLPGQGAAVVGSDRGNLLRFKIPEDLTPTPPTPFEAEVTRSSEYPTVAPPAADASAMPLPGEILGGRQPAPSVSAPTPVARPAALPNAPGIPPANSKR